MFTSQARFNLAFSQALLDQQIVPFLQPIVLLSDGSIAGFEILARWDDPVYESIEAATFIQLADRGGLLDELLTSLLEQSLAVAAKWPPELFLAFNVSPTQLRNPELPDRIFGIAASFGVTAARLHVEITETAILSDQTVAKSILMRFLEMGFSVSMDDFGTGYSSLASLRTLPFSKLKIDTSFVRSMQEQRESRKIVSAVVGLGQSLGVATVAEGVETIAQADLLRAMGCTLAQGYLFGRPMRLEHVEVFLHTSAPVGLAAPMPKLSLEQRASQILAIYRSADVSIGFLNPDCMVVDASETFARRVGAPVAAIIGRHIADLIPAATHWLAILRDARESRRRHPTFEVELPTGGRERVATQRVYDEAGEFLGFSLISMDVSETHRNQDPVHDDDQSFRSRRSPDVRTSPVSAPPDARMRLRDRGRMPPFPPPVWTFGAGGT